MIRIEVSGGDTGYADTPENALYAARTLNQECSAHGYRSISFYDDETDELIRRVTGEELYDVLHEEIRKAAGRTAGPSVPVPSGTLRRRK